MNSKILTLIFVLFFSFSLSAQVNKESREKIKTLKIAYITEQLNLTAKEAQDFWPIYNTYDEEQRSLRGKNRYEIKKLVKQRGNLDSISDKDAERLISLKLKNDKALYESQRDFVNKIKRIISHKKILKLQIAEMEFARKLMRKYKRRK